MMGVKSLSMLLAAMKVKAKEMHFDTLKSAVTSIIYDCILNILFHTVHNVEGKRREENPGNTIAG
jgi:hypothetical protein